ncbi:pyrroline-5-carboxylate reductase [Ramlibacter sp. H39-3-26]|uniref:pyrroline-5-carboxylate reductase n=1 Tax=Curvibacter soli TaxID=3031331 RepID=UPI0023DC1C25|nr:pyrroline-5-carboxylate reductase [Ramlibacter sp. H39-3-26]MDF1484974.1 pyrroline-5-carboxylate reductase [Ramlibacter sp. H39-3-26]
MRTTPALPADISIAFIGGGNMASAIIGGLAGQGLPAARIVVVEPSDEARARLAQQFGIAAHACADAAGTALGGCAVAVWAVKPQTFHEAATAAAPHVARALHLSVAAGIPSGSIARWLGTERIVRAMPNTPALVGQGMTGLFARAGADAADRALVERLLGPTGALLWVDEERLLDAVTALSGSGPAYVFYVIEALAQAGVDMGLAPQQAHRLAVGTFVGASALAAASDEPPAVLRQRVTSKGGTTHAAITALEAAQVKQQFVAAIRAAERRAQELGQEFGAD